MSDQKSDSLPADQSVETLTQNSSAESQNPAKEAGFSHRQNYRDSKRWPSEHRGADGGWRGPKSTNW